MKIHDSAVIAVMCLVLATQAFAAGPDDILGIWNNQEKEAKIEVYRCGQKYCGKIIWLRMPDYPAGSVEGAPGTPKLDNNNPDPNLRSKPRLGLEIVYGFAYAGENRWTDGKVYDPKSGKTYSGKMTLVSPEQLDLRGYMGISLLGRTTSWTR